MAGGVLLFAFLAAGVGFSLLLWQAVQGEGRGETVDRRDAERSARRDQSDDEHSAWGEDADSDGWGEDRSGWGEDSRRDRRE